MEEDKKFQVIVIVWLLLLTAVWGYVAIRWQAVCDRIALTVFEGIAGNMARGVRDYRPAPTTTAVRAEKPKARSDWEKSLFGEKLVRELHPSYFLETTDWKVTDITREPAKEPARSREHDYWIRYERPNGASSIASIRGKPLTTETIRQAVEEKEARWNEIYRPFQ